MVRQPAALCLWILLALALQGCVTGLFDFSAGYDQRPLTLQTLSLFTQRVPSRLARRSWKGDWVFRRDRLELIDEELRSAKPDLLMLQGVMAKVGSTAEGDRRILSAGALLDYDWREGVVEEYADTQEMQSLAIAVGLGSKFVSVDTRERELWLMGTGGFLLAATVDYEDQPVTVFNVQMPPQPDPDQLWYSFVQERIVERLKRLRHCPKRVIVGGFLPGDESIRRFDDFTKKLQLKDLATGFCQIASNCFTATPTNDLYEATVGNESPSRVDRIFTHQSALVYSSGRNFDDPDAGSRYVREFGMSRLWPVQRFGWTAQVRLARCSAAELDSLQR